MTPIHHLGHSVIENLAYYPLQKTVSTFDIFQGSPPQQNFFHKQRKESHFSSITMTAISPHSDVEREVSISIQTIGLPF
jgi:hypothetical protein